MLESSLKRGGKVPRKKIKEGQRIEIGLSLQERKLILEHTFVGPELTRPLARAREVKGLHLVRYTLDDLDELHGYVAAEANHCKSRKIAKALYALCDRLRAEMEKYDDGL